jgi:hypothetical protein
MVFLASVYVLFSLIRRAVPGTLPYKSRGLIALGGLINRIARIYSYTVPATGPLIWKGSSPPLCKAHINLTANDLAAK